MSICSTVWGGISMLLTSHGLVGNAPRSNSKRNDTLSSWSTDQNNQQQNSAFRKRTIYLHPHQCQELRTQTLWSRNRTRHPVQTWCSQLYETRAPLLNKNREWNTEVAKKRTNRRTLVERALDILYSSGPGSWQILHQNACLAMLKTRWMVLVPFLWNSCRMLDQKSRWRIPLIRATICKLALPLTMLPVVSRFKLRVWRDNYRPRTMKPDIQVQNYWFDQ